MPPTAPAVHRVRVDLAQTGGTCVLLVPAAATLAELHQIIQVVFAWSGEHLHAWSHRHLRIGTPEIPALHADPHERPESAVQVGDLARDELTYTYDLGDRWEHRIRVGVPRTPAPGVTYPLLVSSAGGPVREDGNDPAPAGHETVAAALAGWVRSQRP